MFSFHLTSNNNPYKIVVDNIEIEVTRKNVKNLNIRVVKPYGEVKVSAPYFSSEKSVMAFIRDRHDGILSSQKKVRKQTEAVDKLSALAHEKKFLDGESIFVGGKEYQIATNIAGRWSLVLDGQIARFQITKASTAESRQKYLKKGYSEETERVGRHFVQKWEIETGLRCKELKARFMKSRGGTCNTKTRKITLNSQLAVFDKRYIDYVALHEISHIKIPNHGKDFYSFMSKHMKNGKNIRKELNALSI